MSTIYSKTDLSYYINQLKLYKKYMRNNNDDIDVADHYSELAKYIITKQAYTILYMNGYESYYDELKNTN